MAEYKKGIENLPLHKINTHCPIFVIVRNLDTPEDEDDVVAEYKYDLADREDRVKLGKLTFWCCENKHSVETMALKDAEGE